MVSSWSREFRPSRSAGLQASQWQGRPEGRHYTFAAIGSLSSLDPPREPGIQPPVVGREVGSLEAAQIGAREEAIGQGILHAAAEVVRDLVAVGRIEGQEVRVVYRQIRSLDA